MATTTTHIAYESLYSESIRRGQCRPERLTRHARPRRGIVDGRRHTRNPPSTVDEKSEGEGHGELVHRGAEPPTRVLRGRPSARTRTGHRAGSTAPQGRVGHRNRGLPPRNRGERPGQLRDALTTNAGDKQAVSSRSIPTADQRRQLTNAGI